MIDYWCNAFTPDREHLWRRVIANDGLTIRLGARGDDAFTDAAGMVQRMDQAAIAALVLPVCDLPDGAPLDEFAHYALRPSEIDRLATDHPGRFVGMWSVNPDDPADVDAAGTMLDAAWCVGLHTHTHSWNHRFDAPAYESYFALAEQHRVPFVVQAGRSGGHRRHDLGHPAAIAGPARAHPDVPVVLSHLGIPWLDETIRMATEHPNVHIGTATHPPARWPDELVTHVRGAGREKVLFGTGYPLTGHLHVLAQLDRLDLDPETKDALRQGNARRIFSRIPDGIGG